LGAEGRLDSTSLQRCDTGVEQRGRGQEKPEVIEFIGPSGRLWFPLRGRIVRIEKVEPRPTNFWPRGAPGGKIHDWWNGRWRTMEEAKEFVKANGLGYPASSFIKPYISGAYLPFGWVAEPDGEKCLVIYVDPLDKNGKYYADLQELMNRARLGRV
jgi:hypothetical protein